MFTMKIVFALIATGVALWSCEFTGTNLVDKSTPDVELIWVGKVFSGGEQCTPDEYFPPDTKQLLNDAGIAVFATSVEHYAVCAACGCPKYAAMHAARIRKNQLAQAEALGFHSIDDPPSQSIYGKWNWLNSVGGIAGHTLMPPPIVRIEYDRNGLFSYYRSDTLVAATAFTIRREKTNFSMDTCDVIHYQDSLRFVPQIFRIDNDTLKLTDLCFDCYGHAYQRIP